MKNNKKRHSPCTRYGRSWKTHEEIASGKKKSAFLDGWKTKFPTSVRPLNEVQVKTFDGENRALLMRNRRSFIIDRLVGKVVVDDAFMTFQAVADVR
jgi:hypothetical protein